ncbi:hypothetical protein BC830DRAFT_1121498 [Chytriomyces sp. MP71]|nr:hypothetical protein BC830DRAFT_1121498 [Chytriomyces sp. MP71]
MHLSGTKLKSLTFAQSLSYTFQLLLWRACSGSTCCVLCYFFEFSLDLGRGMSCATTRQTVTGGIAAGQEEGTALVLSFIKCENVAINLNGS